jgi:hypothetical protein
LQFLFLANFICAAALRSAADRRFTQLVKRHPSMLKNMTIASLE